MKKSLILALLLIISSCSTGVNFISAFLVDISGGNDGKGRYKYRCEKPGKCCEVGKDCEEDLKQKESIK